MKHLVFIEIDTDTTSRSNPTQFSTVLAAEIISRQTDSRIITVINHNVRIMAFAISYSFTSSYSTSSSKRLPLAGACFCSAIQFCSAFSS